MSVPSLPVSLHIAILGLNGFPLFLTMNPCLVLTRKTEMHGGPVFEEEEEEGEDWWSIDEMKIDDDWWWWWWWTTNTLCSVQYKELVFLNENFTCRNKMFLIFSWYDLRFSMMELSDTIRYLYWFWPSGTYCPTYLSQNIDNCCLFNTKPSPKSILNYMYSKSGPFGNYNFSQISVKLKKQQKKQRTTDIFI